VALLNLSRKHFLITWKAAGIVQVIWFGILKFCSLDLQFVLKTKTVHIVLSHMYCSQKIC